MRYILVVHVLMLVSIAKAQVAPIAYEDSLTWQAPVASTDPVVGYNVYRALGTSGTYAVLNTQPVTATAYIDGTVALATSYSYQVKSVDAQGNQSVPSNTITINPVRRLRCAEFQFRFLFSCFR